MRDFAIIISNRLMFDRGFNVLTGETGAGKSMLIDAVQCVLGGRTTSDMVRTGADTAVIEAVFDVSGMDEVAELLDDAGVPLEEGQLIITREISRRGRNVSRINGRIVTATTVREIAGRLVDICGQHEHQSLLTAGEQLSMVDRFGGREVMALAASFADRYEQWRSLCSDLASLRRSGAERRREIDRLQYEITEIEEVGPSPDEWEQLQEQRQVLGSAEQLMSGSSSAFELLYESAEGGTVVDMAARAAEELRPCAVIDSRLQQTLDELIDCQYRLQSAAQDLARYRESISFDPRELTAVEERLEQLRALRRKFGEDEDEVIAYLKQARERLESLSGAGQSAEQLEVEERERCDELSALSAQLTGMRRQAAANLSAAVAGQLKDLGLAGARFEVELASRSDEDGRPGFNSTGGDECRFLFSANPGEPLRPMARVASGGELARLMLAVKSVVAGRDRVPTVIFDEVDANVGGQVVQAVAEKIAGISRQHQVICVTHQPQIAAVATTHVAVQKSMDRDSTSVVTVRLDGRERELEIARMLGGPELTSVTDVHARELLAGRRPDADK